MAVKVVEGRDYRILPDDYRAEFHKHNKPIKTERKIINGCVYTATYYRCIYCGSIVENKNMQVDHIIPKTRLMAGILWNPNKAWNLGPSCPQCNISKSNYIDSRVIKGFQNKLRNKYGISRKIADMRGKDLNYKEDTTSGDSDSLQKIMPFIMALIYALMVLKPFIIVGAWIVQAAMYIAVRLFKIGGKLTRKTFNNLGKMIKYYIKHPNQIPKLAGKIALITLVIYLVGGPLLGGTALMANLTTFFGGVWAFGENIINNIIAFFS